MSLPPDLNLVVSEMREIFPKLISKTITVPLPFSPLQVDKGGGHGGGAPF